MHHALLAAGDKPDFAPEPLSEHYRHGLYHGMLSLTNQTIQLLRSKQATLPEAAAEDAVSLLKRENELRVRFGSLRHIKTDAVRIRHHGDFHLGQVLYTGRDFIIIDFEGEPARALTERRLRRSPLRDAAGMLRSFQYAAYAALFGQIPGVTARQDNLDRLNAAAESWTAWVGAAYIKGYLSTAGSAPFIPESQESLRILLDAFLLEKAVYEVAYELNNRPTGSEFHSRGLQNSYEQPTDVSRSRLASRAWRSSLRRLGSECAKASPSSATSTNGVPYAESPRRRRVRRLPRLCRGHRAGGALQVPHRVELRRLRGKQGGPIRVPHRNASGHCLHRLGPQYQWNDHDWMSRRAEAEPAQRAHLGL
jgi:hypothetical protein